MSQKLFNEDFISLFVEKNSDCTRHLRLKGRELYQRIGCRVKAKHMSTIAKFLKNYPEIISLDLCYNEIGDEGMTIFSEEYLSEANCLQHLNIMHCDITHKGMESLSNSEHLNLVTCRLNGNKVGALGARYIARIIERCPDLQLMDIGETDQTLESVECILIVIEHSTLKSLDISRIIPNTYFTKYDVSTLADDLSVALKLNQHLVELHIQKCEFDGHDVDVLLSGLRVNKDLQLLDLGCNNIGDYGIEIIAQWLRTRPPLRGLNVSANGIRNFGARALSFGLPFSKIRYLDISNNRLTDWGITDLLDSLKKYCLMRILFMWGNEFGPTSCKRINRMLQSGVLNQEYIDMKIYQVDGKLFAAHYPGNSYKHKYYCVLDYGYPPTLKIQRNQIPGPNALPRELLNFNHLGRYPPVKDITGEKDKKESGCELKFKKKQSLTEEEEEETIYLKKVSDCVDASDLPI